MSREESLRACMAQSLSENIRAARKLLGVKRSDMASRMGLSGEELADIEAGRGKLSGMGYISAAAFLDDFFSRGVAEPGIELSVRRILDTDFEDSGLPEYFTENVRRVFQDMKFLERWFATFDGGINSIIIGADEEFSDNDLELAAENYNIFIDDTAVTDRNFSRLTERLKPFLTKNDEDGCLFITAESIAHLDDDSASALRENGLVRIFETEGTMLEVFAENPGNRFMLITRDEKLAHEIVTSPDWKERKIPVLVAYITPNASLALHGDDYIPPEEPKPDTANDITPEKDPAQEEEYMPEEEYGDDAETVYADLISESNEEELGL